MGKAEVWPNPAPASENKKGGWFPSRPFYLPPERFYFYSLSS
jgi:hypothetical protein